MGLPDWMIDPPPAAEIYPNPGQAKHDLHKVLIVATPLVSFPRVQQAGIFFGASSSNIFSDSTLDCNSIGNFLCGVLGFTGERIYNNWDGF